MSQLLEFSRRLNRFLSHYQELEKQQHLIPNSDLTLAEVHLLVLVGQEPAISLTEVAKRRHSSRSAVTQLVQRLVEKGYLAKRLSREKKSSYGLFLTPKGEQVCSYHEEQHDFLKKALEEVLADYSIDFLNRVEQLMSDLELVWQKLADKNQARSTDEDRDSE